MTAGFWYSQPDRAIQTFGHFDTSMVDDDYTRAILERVKFELEQLNRGCEKPIYHLRAHCWMPDVTPVRYGYYLASFNEMVLSAPLGTQRVIQLPDARTRPGGYIEIVDWGGNAATTNITVKALKGETVNGSASITISTNYAVARCRSDGFNWRVDQSGTSFNIHSLTNDASPDALDEFVYYDVSEGVHNKLSRAELATALGGGAGDVSAPDGNFATADALVKVHTDSTKDVKDSVEFFAENGGFGAHLLRGADVGNGSSSKGVIFRSGNAGASPGDTSGDASVDTGTGGTRGDVELGQTNAEAVRLGRTGKEVQTRGVARIDEVMRLQGQYVGASGNDLAIGAVSVVILTSTANLTGMVKTVDRQLVVILNKAGGDIRVQNDATSTAANRFLTPGGGSYDLTDGGGVMAYYDDASSRWRLVAIAAGAGGGLSEAEIYGRLVAWGVL